MSSLSFEFNGRQLEVRAVPTVGDWLVEVLENGKRVGLRQAGVPQAAQTTLEGIAAALECVRNEILSGEFPIAPPARQD